MYGSSPKPAAKVVIMKDSLGRHIHYLRVSVTDRCNLRCKYCMPAEGVEFIPHDEILRYEEIVRLVRIMAGLGVNRVRLTGGEPLVRKGLPELVESLKAIDGIDYVALTTNGLLLPEQADSLKRSGLDAVNISIDTLDPQRFAALTGKDALDAALAGLEKALAVGFSTVKVNCVLSPDSTRDDWLGVATLADRYGIDVRFIEWMPMAGEEEPKGRVAEVKAALAESYGALTPAKADTSGGPAAMFEAAGSKGRFGFIEAISHKFCDRCNRLRLTSTGHLKLCLFYNVGIPLKEKLRGGASDKEIEAAITKAVAFKPEAHRGVLASELDAPTIDAAKGMYKTGG